ncbi:MAG: hypothetical protein ACLFS0_09455 [Bacteroidales bacterium]
MHYFSVFSLSCILLLLPLHLDGSDRFLSGSRAAAMANASVAIYDTWSVSHNQAGMMRTGHITAAFYTDNRFLLPELSLASFAVIIPFSGSTLGVSFSGFGNSLYREGKAGIAYARSFGDRLSAGVKLSYYFAAFADRYGQTGTAVAELGIIYEPRPGLQIGSHISNPTRAGLSGCPSEGSCTNLPTIIRTGLSYSFSDSVILNLETTKDIRFPPVFRAGVEYVVGDALVLRTGVSTRPVQNAFGIGFQRGRLKIDLAATYHYALGYSPCAAFIYTLQ